MRGIYLSLHVLLLSGAAAVWFVVVSLVAEFLQSPFYGLS